MSVNLQGMVSFLTANSQPACMQGFCMVRISDIPDLNDWTQFWVSLENGALLWYVDDLRSAVSGAAVVTQSDVTDCGCLEGSDLRILKFRGIVHESTTFVDIEIASHDDTIWQSMLELHMSVADESSHKFLEEIVKTHNDQNNFEEGVATATMQVTLKGKPHSIFVTPDDDVELIATKFIDENKLKPEIKSRIETELLRTQVDAFMIHEAKLRKLLYWTRKRACDKVLMEERCFIAENVVANLSEQFAQIQHNAEQVCLKMESMHKGIQSKNNKIDHLTQLMESLQEELVHTEYENHELEDALDSYKMKQNELEKQIQDLKQNAELRAQQQCASDQQLKSIEAELVHTKEMYDQLVSESEGHNSKLEQMTQKYNNMAEKYELAVMTSKRATQRIRNGSVHGRSVGVINPTDDMDIQFHDDIKTMKHKYEERIKLLRSQVHAHDDAKALALAKSEELTFTLNQTNNALRRSEEDVMRLRADVKELKFKLDAFSPSKLSQALADENRSLRKELIENRSEINRLNGLTKEIGESALITIKQVVSDIARQFRENEDRDATMSINDMQDFLNDLQMSLNDAVSSLDFSNTSSNSCEYEAPVVMDENETGDNGVNDSDAENQHYISNKSIDVDVNAVQELNKSPLPIGAKSMADFSKREITFDLVTPIVEDRLLRSVYCKYLSDISSGMNITRMGRFAKEFGIVGIPGNKNKSSNTAYKAPFLTSGEVDMIYLNACKTEDADNGGISAWEEHMGVVVTPTGKTRSPFSVKNAKGYVSSKNAKNGERNANTGHTGPQHLSINQFVTCMRAIATRLYSPLIEQQTGTILECLPPRQKEVATAAALEVLLKKKIVPVAEMLGLLPWPLIFLDQTLISVHDTSNMGSVLNSKLDMTVEMFNHYASVMVVETPKVVATPHQQLVAEHEATEHAITSPSQHLNLSRKSNFKSPTQPKPPPDLTIQALTYQSLSKLGHDYGIIPLLIKESDFFSQFEEIVLWCKTDADLVLSALPNSVLYNCSLFQEEVEWRHAFKSIQDYAKKHAVALDKQKKSSSRGPNPQTAQVLGMASFLVLLTTLGIQVERNVCVIISLVSLVDYDFVSWIDFFGCAS